MKSTRDAVLAYLEAWNENDAVKRAALLSQCWADDGIILNEREQLNGRASVEARIASFREQCPHDRGRLTSEIQVCGNWFRFTAEVVRPDGSRYSQVLDVGEIDSEGRIVRIVTFNEPLGTRRLSPVDRR
jgi:hypothetical protein